MYTDVFFLHLSLHIAKKVVYLHGLLQIIERMRHFKITREDIINLLISDCKESFRKLKEERNY